MDIKNTRQQASDSLEQYFKWLSDQLASGQVNDEASLSQTVEIPRVDRGGVPTLLQALGYDAVKVQPQAPVQIGTRRFFVDFQISMSVTGKHCWMLDLKSPDESCGDPKFGSQLTSYLQLSKVPLGVLFNGKEARAYVSPTLKGLDEQIDWKCNDVKRASASIPDELISFFREFELRSANE